MTTLITIYVILNMLWIWFAMYKVNQYKTAKWYHKAITFVLNGTLFPICFVWAILTEKFTTQALDEGTDYKSEQEARWFQLNELIIIKRIEDDNKPYLVRRTLISFGQWFSIKYHKILLSDDQCMHCHPWPFITIILKGGYFEWTPIHQKDSGERVKSGIGTDGGLENCHWHKPGSVMYRPADWIHRLELADKHNRKLTPAHTLVFTGKVVRDWGFYTSKGWIFWKNYNSKRDC